MNRVFSIAIGISATVLATAGCAADRDTPAAPTTTVTVSSTVSPAVPAATTSTTTPAAPAPTSSASPTSSTPMVGGMTECTKEALAEPATSAAQALGPKNLYTVETLSCADGWAVTGGVLSSTDNPGTGAPTSFVFEQQGQFWIPKDKAVVCGTNPVTTTAPSDAEIPADLFVAGCAAG